MKAFLALIAVLSCIVAAVPAMAQHDHGHGADPIVGRTLAGKLSLEADFDECFRLMPIENSPLPNYAGWSMDDPGFFALEEDEPAEDFYRLGAGADIWLKCASINSAFKVRDAEALNFPVRISAAGQQFHLGDHQLHIHPIWHIDSLDAGFNPLQTEWHATFTLIDLGSTGYAESDPFTMCFTNVPEPATLALVGLGSLAAVRRRRPN